jgi:hypothetical protein
MDAGMGAIAPFSTPLSASAQSAYAELLEVTRHQELARSVENLSGSFNRKTVKGATYWYYQFRDSAGGATRQIFIGPDSDQLRALVERARTKNTSHLDALAKSAMALGCAAATPAHFRIVRRLNEIGFFHAGGVLVGAHAFLSYGNALGVSWGDLGRTQDIDFAHSGKDLELALPATLTINAKDAITSLEAGLLPVPGFRPWDKTGSFISKVDKQLRVDFLAPMVGGKSQPYEHDGLGVPLQPLRFLEFILEDIQQAVVISAVGAVMANVPDPGRYALHKILVFVERRARNPEKAKKDLRQAAALLQVLEEFRIEDLGLLWNDLLQRGPGWRERARKGLSALGDLAPGLRMLEPMRATLEAFKIAKTGRRPRLSSATPRQRK